MSQRKRLTGTVKWFSGQRRYGFVAPDIGGEDLFVHYNSIRSEGSRVLTQGDVVEFSVEKGENGRMKAVNVTGPAGTEIPVGASSGGGDFSGWSKGGGVGREEFGRGGGRSWGSPCYNCGQNGHLARDCPPSYQGGAGGAGHCFNCGQSGHLARDCKQTSGGSNSRGFGGSCYNCGESGHLARDCKQTSGDSNSRGFGGSCYNCGESGHLARDCNQERANFVNFSIGGYSGGGRGCYNCGEPGHLARDCSNNDDN